MRRVTGLGGLFFKADDPEALYAWYEKHLGIQREEGNGVAAVGTTRSLPHPCCHFERQREIPPCGTSKRREIRRRLGLRRRAVLKVLPQPEKPSP